MMPKIIKSNHIVLTGGAGLVGQNLVFILKKNGFTNITVIDKNYNNLSIMKSIHKDINFICEDLSESGVWCSTIEIADVIVILHAQIGGNNEKLFIKNNILSTKLIIDILNKRPKDNKVIHISSSVVLSSVVDLYVTTKYEQEKLISNSSLNFTVLRPTLMYGLFDRKHLGWLSRFMKNFPLFPVPGNGRYKRQPLYVNDFCNIIIDCIIKNHIGKVYNISGLQHIDYIDIIYKMKKILKVNTIIFFVPYNLFYFLIWIWGIFDKNPPFTTKQLISLCADDDFEIINWPQVFNVSPTSIDYAFHETFNSHNYSDITLKF